MAFQSASQGGAGGSASLAGISGARGVTASDHFPAHLFALPPVAFRPEPQSLAPVPTFIRYGGNTVTAPVVAKEKYAPRLTSLDMSGCRRGREVDHIAPLATTQHHYQGAGRFN